VHEVSSDHEEDFKDKKSNRHGDHDDDDFGYFAHHSEEDEIILKNIKKSPPANDIYSASVLDVQNKVLCEKKNHISYSNSIVGLQRNLNKLK
jgi:hypothetical protein